MSEVPAVIIVAYSSSGWNDLMKNNVKFLNEYANDYFLTTKFYLDMRVAQHNF